MRVLFAGGGTGGHLFPAIAIARQVQRLMADAVIEFVGTRYGLEYRMKDDLGYPLRTVSMRGLPRSISPALLAFPFRLIISVIQALAICRRFKPDIVVGTGGYVAAPALIAAALKNIPRAIQEQNSFPGLVTRKMARHVDIVFIAYRRSESYLPAGTSIKSIGNPIRRELTEGNRDAAIAHFNLDPNRKTILILGGSQGARRINEAILQSIDHLDDRIQLLWQCGKRDYKDVAGRLDNKDIAVSLFPFSNNMELVYAAADLAIARAGALTIAELMACGIPAIFVPFPFAAADHQTHNAREVVDAGAAEMIADADLETIDVLQRAAEIVTSDRLLLMKQAAIRLGRPDAAEEIAREIIHLAGHKGVVLDNEHY